MKTSSSRNSTAASCRVHCTPRRPAAGMFTFARCIRRRGWISARRCSISVSIHPESSTWRSPYRRAMCRSCGTTAGPRSEEHTSELQSLRHLVCRLLLEKKKKKQVHQTDCRSTTAMHSETSLPTCARDPHLRTARLCYTLSFVHLSLFFLFFFFNNRAPPKISPFPLPAPLPI